MLLIISSAVKTTSLVFLKIFYKVSKINLTMWGEGSFSQILFPLFILIKIIQVTYLILTIEARTRNFLDQI